MFRWHQGPFQQQEKDIRNLALFVFSGRRVRMVLEQKLDDLQNIYIF